MIGFFMIGRTRCATTATPTPTRTTTSRKIWQCGPSRSELVVVTPVLPYLIAKVDALTHSCAAIFPRMQIISLEVTILLVMEDLGEKEM